MFKFSENDILLLTIVSNLKNYPYYSGGEGNAYFVGEDYVLKRYINKTEKDFDGIFENYCVEMQNFANNGLSVPKIYAWTKLPSVKRNVHGKSYDYYILQERMKGRTLFHGFIEDIYPLCKKLCSKEQFNQAVKYQEKNVALFKEILTEYVTDYQRMNEYLCSMPENQIDDFIYNLYVMCLDGKYSIPDIYPSNTLLSDDGFSIIDNRVEDRISRGYTTQKFAETILTSGLVWLFFYNGLVTSNPQEISKIPECQKYIIANREKITKPCREAIIRFVSRMNVVCCKPKITNKTVLKKDFDMLSKTLSKEDAEEIMGLYQIDFE